MAGYVKKLETQVTFDGQQIDVEMKPLSYADLLLLRKDDQAEVLRAYQGVLPRYVLRMSPILDQQGQTVSIDEIVEAAYFAPLVAQILAKHLDAAMAPQLPTSAGQSSG